MIEDLAESDPRLTKAEIHRRVHAAHGEGVVSIKTVEAMVERVRGLDPTSPWRLDADSAGVEDAELLLLVLQNLLNRGGNGNLLTMATAKMICRLNRATAGELQPWGLFVLARRYVRRKGAKEPTGDLDSFLAFTPWKSEEHWEDFGRVLGVGQVELPTGVDTAYAKAAFVELVLAIAPPWLPENWPFTQRTEPFKPDDLPSPLDAKRVQEGDQK